MDCLCLERLRKLVETHDIIGYRKATEDEVFLADDGSTVTGVECQHEHFIVRRREPADVAASIVCAKCHHWASFHGPEGCRTNVSHPFSADPSPVRCGCMETFPRATQAKAPTPQPLTDEQQIRNHNRELCEQILARSIWTTDHTHTLAPIPRDKLSDTPFRVIGALIWAYRALDSRDAEMERLKTLIQPGSLGATLMEELDCLKRFLACVLDKLGDRLYHADDGTWWCREGLELKAADAPPTVEQQKHALDAALDLTAQLTRKLADTRIEMAKRTTEAQSVRRENERLGNELQSAYERCHLAEADATDARKKQTDLQKGLTEAVDESLRLKRLNDGLKFRQKELERAVKAIQEHRVWFDTCTKTEIEGWEDKAAAASEELDAALEALKGPQVPLEIAPPIPTGAPSSPGVPLFPEGAEPPIEIAAKLGALGLVYNEIGSIRLGVSSTAELVGVNKCKDVLRAAIDRLKTTTPAAEAAPEKGAES